MTRAFRAPRGVIGGSTFLLLSVLLALGLSGCGAPAFTYVADSSAGTYYKVPAQWHQISQKSLNTTLQAGGGSGSGAWSTAFDGAAAPSAAHDDSVALTQPFVLAEVGQLSSAATAEVSYNALRDLWLPVTSDGRQEATQDGFAGTGFKQLRDQVIRAKQGVHGVRETFQYTFSGVTDTFDEEVLTNADQTVLYMIQVHCTAACYSHNEASIGTVMSSFTIGSPT